MLSAANPVLAWSLDEASMPMAVAVLLLLLVLGLLLVLVAPPTVAVRPPDRYGPLRLPVLQVTPDTHMDANGWVTGWVQRG